MTTGDKGKLFILFLPSFTFSLLSKIVCSLCFISIYALGLKYHCDLVHVKEKSGYSLRSNEGILPLISEGKIKKSSGDRVFAVALPKIRHGLPFEVKNKVKINRLKQLFKTY